ncbi:hypothetical protein PanWU01x14_067820 [Parasponia andersonii]|uniref:Uncharacterized protein n=1 Tax=Parasponia andersonii TaxID=3476 RepID=A0A2P5DFA6_PARAD|nr:hypothetical protein PanWU01x14_067820 [Parasponia andersonii]
MKPLFAKPNGQEQRMNPCSVMSDCDLLWESPYEFFHYPHIDRFEQFITSDQGSAFRKFSQSTVAKSFWELIYARSSEPNHSEQGSSKVDSYKFKTREQPPNDFPQTDITLKSLAMEL